MAKVINPLLSASASGQIGHMMTFDRRGYVRQYVVPANPQTANQMAVRNALADIQAELKTLGAVLRAESKSGLGYRWNSVIIGELMANNKAVYTQYKVEYDAFDAPSKSAWAAADVVTPIALVKGELLYCLARGLYDLAMRAGVVISLTLPVAGNSATVAAEWADDIV